MSGASGKILSAIHVYPEAKNDGLLAYIHDGDVVRIDAATGELALLVEQEELVKREAQPAPTAETTLGRGLFRRLRELATESGDGASII